MLKRMDRVQIAVGELNGAEKIVSDTFAGEPLGRDEVAPLRARRSRIQCGASVIELLAPDGAGPVKDFVERWQQGLFAAGFAVDDIDALAKHLERQQVRFERANGQLFLDSSATFGMRAVISARHERAPVGLLKWTYEVTNVVANWNAAAERYAKLFALDAGRFCPITSPEFGYTGTLTLFDAPARLDRIEISQIADPSLAMGRFHQRRGDSLYMFYAETDDVGTIAKRLDARGVRYSAPRRDEAGLSGLFIHPTAFLGVLVGISRTENAWLWSGDAERARRYAQRLAQRG